MVILLALAQEFLDPFTAFLKHKDLFIVILRARAQESLESPEESMEFMEEDGSQDVLQELEGAPEHGPRASGAVLHCGSTPKSSKRSSPRSRETSMTAVVRAARHGKSSSVATPWGRSR